MINPKITNKDNLIELHIEGLKNVNNYRVARIIAFSGRRGFSKEYLEKSMCTYIIKDYKYGEVIEITPTGSVEKAEYFLTKSQFVLERIKFDEVVKCVLSNMITKRIINEHKII